MNNFIVSARKYRPSNFKTVVGQDYIVTTLKNAIKNNQLAQAFLFTGPRGVGKTTCARILAKTINCTNITTDFEACNECESCKSFNQSASFNVHELDAASNNSVEDIRSLVEQVRIPPQAGQYKIYIIDEVHMLSTAAFNAFLKTLEEPPSYAKFILATTEKHKIIPTILSRCQVFDFKRIKVDDITKHLQYVAASENIEAEVEALHIISTKSDGALRDALSTFDQMASFATHSITYKDVIENLNILDYDYHFKIVDYCLNNDISNVLLILNEIYDKGFDGQAVISGLSTHLRSLLICKDAVTLPLLELHETIIDDYKRQALKCNLRFLVSALEIINKCDVGYKSSSNKRFHLELAVLKIAGINESISNYNNPANPTNLAVESNRNNIATENPKPMQAVELSPSPSSSPAPTEQSSSPKNEVSAVQIEKKPITTTSQPQQNIFGPSIKNIQISKEAELQQNSTMDDAYTEQKFEEVWEKFKNNLKELEGKDYECSLLANIKPIKKAEHLYSITLNSTLEAENIKSLEISSFFHKELNNKLVKFEVNFEKPLDAPKVQSKNELFREYVASEKEIQNFINDLSLFPEA